jgi:hypothetical protein
LAGIFVTPIHDKWEILSPPRHQPSKLFALHPVDVRVGNVRNDAGLVAPLAGLFPA